MQLIRKDKTSTSLGCLSKGLYRDNLGELYLVKGNILFNDGHYGYEPYSKVIASIVAKHLGFDCMSYELVSGEQYPEISCYGINSLSICKWYKTPSNTQRLTALQYMELYTSKKISTNYWQVYKQIVPNIYPTLDMLVLDAIIGNEDRHLNNWELLIGENYFCYVPIFDNGASLLAYVPDNKLSPNRFIGRDKAKPFKPTHERQIALIKKYYPNYSLPFTQCTYNVILENILRDIEPILQAMPEYRAECVREYLIKRFKHYTSLLL